MIPIEEIPRKEITEREQHVVEEIEAFMAHKCKNAYVDMDESISLTRNREIYNRVLRKMRIYNVQVKQFNLKLYLSKV